MPTLTPTAPRADRRPRLSPTTQEHADARSCDVCPHPLAEHDGIASRFCRATRASALDRGCACSTS
jgi:hypothetical protein